MEYPIIFDARDFACPHCGTPNPDGGDKCGNCGGEVYVLPPPDAYLTDKQLKTLQSVTSRRRL